MTSTAKSKDLDCCQAGHDAPAVESEALTIRQSAPFAPQDASPREPYLSPKEVAALLAVDERTLRRWARNGRLVPRRLGPTVGSTLRYDPRDVDAFLSNGSSKT
jgi:excisionase family DNA binding protein